MVNTIADTNAAIWSILETVMDPEVPVLSVVDLGVIRAVAKDGQQITVTITPTYTGCPAMDMIAMQIRMALMAQDMNRLSKLFYLRPGPQTG